MNARNSRLFSKDNQLPFKESFDKHNQLYKDYKERQMRIQQLSEQVYSVYNFIPETNNNYKGEKDFFERQEIHKRKVHEKLIE